MKEVPASLAVVKICMAPPARLITIIRNVINCSLAREQIVLSFESHTGPRQFLTDIRHWCHKSRSEKHTVQKNNRGGQWERGKKNTDKDIWAVWSSCSVPISLNNPLKTQDYRGLTMRKNWSCCFLWNFTGWSICRITWTQNTRFKLKPF